MTKYPSLAKIRAALHSREITCREVVEYYLKNILEKDSLNAFIEVYEQGALERADQIDARIASGTAGKLAGLVVGIKDVLCYKDHKVQASSRILDGFVSKYSATAIERLLEQDAVIIGRQNCDEFAMGASNETSWFGPVKNATDPSRVSGGSSGGSAVAVQADMCLVSLGSDTGGSVRQPAAFCGLVGLKPTYGRISRFGLFAYGSSFDCIGIIARNADDCGEVLEVIAGADHFDATVSLSEKDAYSSLVDGNKKYKIAYIKETVENEVIDEDVRKNTLEKIEFLKDTGHTVEVVDFPLLEYVLPTYYILATAEASTNLARYDGVRYGRRAESARNLEELYKKTRSEGFGVEVKKRIMLGTFVLSADYYDAYFTKAQKVRRIIKESTDKLLSEYDFLVLPMTPSPAFKIGDFEKNPMEMYYADLFTVQANIAGNPAISVPNGTSCEGLPIGLQIIAGKFKEKELLLLTKNIMNS